MSALWLSAPVAADGDGADAGPASSRHAAGDGLSRAGPKPLLRVAVVGSPPFVQYRSDGQPDGFSVAVLRRLARRADVRVRVQPYPTVEDALAGLSQGAVDLAAGPISVTAARAARIQFLQPYYSARVGIVVSQGGSVFGRLAPFLSNAFLVGVVSLVLVLLLVGFLIWLAERRRNASQFPPEVLRGVGNGMWFALVTMTTVGYGDRAPVTVAGRLLTSVWMVVAIITASSLTAGIASALTLAQIAPGEIHDLSDVAQHRVAVVNGSPSAAVARRHRARLVAVEDKEAGLDLVRRGRVDALLYDLPVLDHHLREHPDLPLSLVRTDRRVDDYAFAVSPGSPWERRLNRALIGLREQGVIDELAERWLVDGGE